MSPFTFNNRFPDGSPRRLAGTWRPTLAEATDQLNSMTADEFNAFSTAYPSGEHSFEEYAWKLGRFDRPLFHVEEWE